jgi:[ribosomal protein S5]-alanine N-acetyltransferase
MENFLRLETKRLILRQITPSDAHSLWQVFGDEAVAEYYDLDAFTEVAQAERLIARMNDRYSRGEAQRWGITLKSDRDIVIGTCGFTHFERRSFRGEIGYDLMRVHWGQGIMPEAVGAVARHGFENLDLNRIDALVIPGNDASARVLEKVGFQREGVLREYGFWKNRFWDLQMFALLKREWSKEQDGHGS